jgi:hypothetical protein
METIAVNCETGQSERVRLTDADVAAVNELRAANAAALAAPTKNELLGLMLADEATGSAAGGPADPSVLSLVVQEMLRS